LLIVISFSDCCCPSSVPQRSRRRVPSESLTCGPLALSLGSTEKGGGVSDKDEDDWEERKESREAVVLKELWHVMAQVNAGGQRSFKLSRAIITNLSHHTSEGMVPAKSDPHFDKFLQS
jgi:hypothetical protein